MGAKCKTTDPPAHISAELPKPPPAARLRKLVKYSGEAVISSDANRFKVDPRQSYVPKETREKDREFWLPK
jgi:hypothetical protein